MKVDWYCTLFEDLGVTKVGNGAGWQAMNDTEFAAFAANVDVWIYTDTFDLQEMITKYSFLENLDSYKNKRIYDVSLRTMSSWYTDKPMEADTIHEDFAKVSYGDGFSFLDGQGTMHEMQYLRNVFTETSKDPLAAPCQGSTKVSLAEQCIVFSEVDLTGTAQKLSGGLLSFITAGAAIVSLLSSLE